MLINGVFCCSDNWTALQSRMGLAYSDYIGHLTGCEITTQQAWHYKCSKCHLVLPPT